VKSGMRQQRAPGPGSRTTGDGGTVMSGMTEERERLAVLKNQVLVTRVSLYLCNWRRAILIHVSLLSQKQTCLGY
jgi:hypothetical protein